MIYSSKLLDPHNYFILIENESFRNWTFRRMIDEAKPDHRRRTHDKHFYSFILFLIQIKYLFSSVYWETFLEMPSILADYNVISEIGKGTFGKCCKVQRVSDDKLFCWKQVFYGQMSESEKESLVREVNLLRYCSKCLKSV